MRQYHLAATIGFGLLTLAGCAAQQREASWQDASIPPLQPNQARVWVLRMPSQAGLITGADPMVYVNGASLAKTPLSTVYYHDFQPGTYRFTVQPFGTPTREHDTLQLEPGTQTYVQVQWEPAWEANRVGGGSSFTVLTSSPEVAQQYLPTLTNLGQR